MLCQEDSLLTPPLEPWYPAQFLRWANIQPCCDKILLSHICRLRLVVGNRLGDTKFTMGNYSTRAEKFYLGLAH